MAHDASCALTRVIIHKSRDYRRRFTICARCKQRRHYHARHLCYDCHVISRRDGTLHDYPRLTIKRSDVLDTYQILRKRLPHDTRQDVIASHMGMTVVALRGALDRERRRLRDAGIPLPLWLTPRAKGPKPR